MSLQVPREPLLALLFQVWKSHPTKTIIRDLADGFETTVEKFLHDVLTMRERILESLDPEVKDRLSSTDTDVFMGVLVGPGHEFAVLAFALYSIGAVIVPLCRSFCREFPAQRYGVIILIRIMVMHQHRRSIQRKENTS